eukprot:Sspe_Gene.101690::Locus_76310_Transcript_1_1_Confidence_1.000_Length_684::g.101690::m.101690
MACPCGVVVDVELTPAFLLCCRCSLVVHSSCSKVWGARRPLWGEYTLWEYVCRFCEPREVLRCRARSREVGRACVLHALMASHTWSIHEIPSLTVPATAISRWLTPPDCEALHIVWDDLALSLTSDPAISVDGDFVSFRVHPRHIYPELYWKERTRVAPLRDEQEELEDEKEGKEEEEEEEEEEE